MIPGIIVKLFNQRQQSNPFANCNGVFDFLPVSLARFTLLFLLSTFLILGFGKAHAEDLQSGEAIRVLLIPKTETIFSSEIAANINNITVDFGDRFRKGDKLITFGCEMYKADLKKAKAELSEATNINTVNTRLEKLKSISTLEVAVSVARMDRAKAEVELRKTQVSKCQVKAPFSGRVIKRSANLFQYVMPGQPLLEVIDDRNLTVQIFVPSNWLSWIKPGIAFTVKIDETNKKYDAKITTLGARVDQVSQSLQIRAKIKGAHNELLAGMSGTAFFKVK